MSGSVNDDQSDEGGRDSSPDVEGSAAMQSVWDALHPPEPDMAALEPDSTHGTNIPDPSPVSDRSLCHLVTLSSTILPPRQKVAIIEPHDVVKVGRDRQPEAQIRLKEMAVSKHHAYIYWDEGSSTWGLVDCGSVHGTFVRSMPSDSDDFHRLSPPRNASIPRFLRDQDVISIGATQFTVHIHSPGNPCDGCADNGKNTIPLLPAEVAKPPADIAASNSNTYQNLRQTPQEAIKSLKASLLRPTHRHSTFPSSTSEDNTPPTLYIDRSKKRRERFGTEEVALPQSTTNLSREKRPRYEDPRVASVVLAAAPSAGSLSSSSSLPLPTPTLISAPPVPLPETNVGHRLLMKSGWTPGQRLGAAEREDRSALLEPLQPVLRDKRAGLGSSAGEGGTSGAS